MSGYAVELKLEGELVFLQRELFKYKALFTILSLYKVAGIRGPKRDFEQAFLLFSTNCSEIFDMKFV